MDDPDSKFNFSNWPGHELEAYVPSPSITDDFFNTTEARNNNIVDDRNNDNLSSPLIPSSGKAKQAPDPAQSGADVTANPIRRATNTTFSCRLLQNGCSSTLIVFLKILACLLLLPTIMIAFSRFFGKGFNGITIEPGASFSLSDYADSLPDSSNSSIENIGEQTAKFYNGIVPNDSYFLFDVGSPSFPKNPVTVLGGSLKQGGNESIVQYVAQWSPHGQPPHWGVVTSSGEGKVEGFFIVNNRIHNLASMKGEPIQLLQYVGNERSNNFKFVWVPARGADLTTAVLLREPTNSCSPRLVPAVYREHGYEFLGEADIDNRVMKHVFQGGVENINEAQFTDNVYLLTKQQCSCSCPAQPP